MGEQVAARFNGGVAQSGEHLPCTQGVKGSNPSISIACILHNAPQELRSFGRVQARYKIEYSYLLMKASFQHKSEYTILHCTLKTAYRKYKISLTQKIQDIREKTKMFVNTNEPKTNVHNAI